MVKGPQQVPGEQQGPTLLSGCSQAVPAPPLAGARVQPDKDGLLFCIKKSILPSDVPVIGRDVHRHQLAAGRGQGQGLQHLRLPSLRVPHLAGRQAAPWWTPSQQSPSLPHHLPVDGQPESHPWRKPRARPSPGSGGEMLGGESRSRGQASTGPTSCSAGPAAPSPRPMLAD